MFAPKMISSNVQPRKRAEAARASSTRASSRLLVAYGAPVLPLDSRYTAATAAATSSGVWVPPGASRKTKSPWSELKRARAAAIAGEGTDPLPAPRAGSAEATSAEELLIKRKIGRDVRLVNGESARLGPMLRMITRGWSF